MKKYRDIAFVAAHDSATFLDKLQKNIDEFQKQGYEVEVQYASAGGQLTALIMSYENPKIML